MEFFNTSARKDRSTQVNSATLLRLIELKKDDFKKAQISEKAMLEGDVNPRKIKVQTSIARQKYFFLLRAARDQNVSTTWQHTFENMKW